MKVKLNSERFIATTPVYARIDSNLKENAEAILHQLGISPASAIQMLYSQIVLKRGIPFDLQLPVNKPLAAGAMTREEIDSELRKSIESLRNGKGCTAEEVDDILEKEFGI
ncbi:MAG: type II toxin-antitoxin system RelB/DinJ family antitoxin [Clostridia bacterium]|nr:type II toxin-antitoxin system RelB/DinJ family antitoxin [Clostridia bacterium]